MKFLDTNILLRYLLADDKKQSPAARNFFSKVEKGEEEVRITPLVLAEVVYFLERNLFSRKKIAKIILKILSSPFIFLEDKEDFEKIFKIYTEENIDFVDAYHAVYCHKNNIKEVISFDRDFDKTKIVKRKKP
ncbi:MAG: PIN domain-containing protein [Microgenomates group bacterium]